MNELEKVDERPDSIEVAQGASGKFSFKVKRYYNHNEDDPKLVIDSMKKAYDYAKVTFEG